jgi:hypothetical protein
MPSVAPKLSDSLYLKTCLMSSLPAHYLLESRVDVGWIFQPDEHAITD